MGTDLGGIKEVLLNKPLQYQEAHRLNYAEVQRASLDQQMKYAWRRDWFWEQDNHVIKSYLENDLRLYYVDQSDITHMKLITLDFFISAFLKKLCNVYDTPPVFKFEEKVNEESETRFNKLMTEVDIKQKMAENFEKMRLHNTIMVYVQYAESLDLMHIQNGFNVGNTYIIEHPEYSLEWDALAYVYVTEKQDVRWVVWDRKTDEHYILLADKSRPKFLTEKESKRFDGKDYLKIGDNKTLDAPKYDEEGTMPWVTYRFQDHNRAFWGNGFDSLVELVRVINVLLTVAEDDTIQETIRILMLDFDPIGTLGEGGTTKVGLRHPVFPRGGTIGGDGKPSGQILSADLYNDEIYTLVDKLAGIASNMHNIDSPLKERLTQDLSGIALRLRAEPLMRSWALDINKLRKSDMELIKMIVLVNNYHRTDNQIDVKMLESLNIDYQQPHVVSDENSDYELERMKWEDGMSSPVQYIMKLDPEIKSEKDAKEKIKENLKDSKEVGLQTRTTEKVGGFALRRLGGETGT